MKSKAPLVMLEQMVMILVFALAAALCMQAFVLSDSLSKQAERRDAAVLLCQNFAENAKADACSSQDGGSVLAAEQDAQAGTAVYYFDEDCQRTEGPAAYRLEAEVLPEELPALGRALLRAFDEATGEELYSLEFAWQRQGVD